MPPEEEQPNDIMEAAAAPASEAPAADPAAPEERTNIDVLHYDPFAEGSPLDPKAAPAVTAESKAEGDGGAPAPEPPKEEPTASVDPVVAELQKLQAQLAQQAPQPSKEEAPAPDAPRFQVDLAASAPQLVQALVSDDPAERGQAVNAIVNGVANMVYAAAREDLLKEMGDFRSQIPDVINQHSTAIQTAQTVQRDFYGKYPELDNPIFKPVVVEVAKQLLQEDLKVGRQFAGWTPEFGDRIAATLASHGIGKQQAAPAPAKPPQANFLNGSRPAPAPTNDIEATLFG